MARPRLLLLLLGLALLLPLFGGLAGAELCGEEGCCPPDCTLCFCCAPVVTELSVPAGVGRSLPPTVFAGAPAADRCSSFDPRDVFHVPKPA